MRSIPMEVRIGMLMGKRDRELLKGICRAYNLDTMSAAIRALIRQEAKRLDIQAPEPQQPNGQEA